MASVQFLVDGNVVATDTTAPYSTSWNSATTANGSHTITVRATDGAGNVATSAPVPVTVNNVAPAVVMQITSLNGHGQVGFFSWTSWVDVNVADQNGQPVAGATVTFAVSGGTDHDPLVHDGVERRLLDRQLEGQPADEQEERDLHHDERRESRSDLGRRSLGGDPQVALRGTGPV